MPLIQPFDQSGIVRGSDGIARFQDLPRSVGEMLRLTVDQMPDAEFLVEVGGERLTYRQAWDRSARVAGGLRAAGIKRGDRVAIRLGNGVNWCLAFFGIQLAGAIAVPVNTRFSASEVEYVVNDSGAKFVFLPDQPLPDGPPLAVEDVNAKKVSAIFYTSGTTGFPKGAMIDSRELSRQCRELQTCGDRAAACGIARSDLRAAISRHGLQFPVAGWRGHWIHAWSSCRCLRCSPF